MGLLCSVLPVSVMGGFSQQRLLFSMLISSSIIIWAILILTPAYLLGENEFVKLLVSEKYEFGGVQ
jgi:hypothetical protein